MDGWDGQIDGWTDGWVDGMGWMGWDGWMNVTWDEMNRMGGMDG